MLLAEKGRAIAAGEPDAAEELQLDIDALRENRDLCPRPAAETFGASRDQRSTTLGGGADDGGAQKCGKGSAAARRDDRQTTYPGTNDDGQPWDPSEDTAVPETAERRSRQPSNLRGSLDGIVQQVRRAQRRTLGV